MNRVNDTRPNESICAQLLGGTATGNIILGVEHQKQFLWTAEEDEKHYAIIDW